VDLEALRVAHEEDLARFAAAEEALARRTSLPMRFDYPGIGTVLVDECELIGRPGKAFLRLHFTWVNTTTTTFPLVQARLTLFDPATETEWSQTLDMRLPYRLSMGPDSSYTSWFEMPTRGVHLHEGWEWEIDLRLEDGKPR